MADAYFPSRVPIDAYGNGGFKFADGGHAGSLLMLPSGVYSWHVQSMDELSVESFSVAMAEAKSFEFLLLGTGQNQVFPDAWVRDLFEQHELGLEPMSTGAACRTYNVLLAEERAVAAALIAIA